MLAAWSRLKHPELIHASIASSAPVAATYDMPQYLDHVAYAYTVADSGVGGSLACRDAIRKGHSWVEARFMASDVAAVTEKFGLAEGSLGSLVPASVALPYCSWETGLIIRAIPGGCGTLTGMTDERDGGRERDRECEREEWQRNTPKHHWGPSRHGALNFHLGQSSGPALPGSS